MRPLNAPRVDDNAVLALFGRHGSGRELAVVPYAASVRERYAKYHQGKGDPWVVGVVNTFEPIDSALKGLYDSPTEALAFIASLRDGEEGACPMCGGSGIGTLDHFLPRHGYAEYSFFSANLVPACSRCNCKRGTTVSGGNELERPLHPYFDEVHANRVLTISIRPDYRAPRLIPTPFGLAGDARATVQWHIDNVVVGAGIEKALRRVWASIVNSPLKVFGRSVRRGNFETRLEEQIEREEEVSGSPNCWGSALFHGLSMDAAAKEYVMRSLPD